jgi:hypothetical protein
MLIKNTYQLRGNGAWGAGLLEGKEALRNCRLWHPDFSRSGSQVLNDPALRTSFGQFRT